MAIEARAAAALVLLAVAAGCAQRGPTPTGIIFTYATKPLTKNFQQTPVVDFDRNSGSVFEVQYYVRISWGDNSLGGLAEEAGFDEIYYADVTTMSIYTYFRMDRVRVYGHRKGMPPVPPRRELEVAPEQTP